MEEYERIGRETLDGHAHDVPRPRHHRLPMSETASGLQSPFIEPLPHQRKALRTVVVLVIREFDRDSVLDDRDALRYAVGDPGDELGEVERRIDLVIDAEQEHLSVELVHSAHGALRNVRREGKRVLQDDLGSGPGSRKGEAIWPGTFFGTFLSRPFF